MNYLIELAFKPAAANNGIAGLLLSAMLCSSLPASAENRLPAPNWDRELAIQTAAMGQDEQQLNSWFGMLRSGRSAELLRAIREYCVSPQVSAPVRERQLFLLTQGLSDFPADMIPSDLLDVLEAYPPETLVPHAEDASIAVPLFNVPAAATGVRHGIERQSGQLRSAQLLSSGPRAWIQGYLAASAPARAGFREGLEGASGQQMEALKQSTLQDLDDQPELFAVAAAAALATADRAAIEHLALHGRNAYLAPMLRSATSRLSQDQQAGILLAAIESAPAENAALAIAVLAPGLNALPAVTDSLFDLLEDPALGSAAALALSRHPEPEVRQRLSRIAEGGDAVAKRVRMVSELSAEGDRR
jgi:hypothetical protein